MKKIAAMSNSEIIVEMGRRFKEYRLTYRLTQQEAADRVGMSAVTLRQFENGKAFNMTMVNFLSLLRLVDQIEQVDELLPEIPMSAFVLEKLQKQKPKRVRHGQ